MSRYSWRGYYEPIDSTALADDRPVDTFTTLTAMDNIAHLVDVSPCYRINWVDPTGVNTSQLVVLGGSQFQTLRVAHEFPVTTMREWAYTGFDVRVAASVKPGGTLFVSATIQSPDADLNADLTNPMVFGRAETTITSDTPAWVIDTQMFGTDRNVQQVGTYLPVTNIATGNQDAAYTARCRLVIQFIAAFGTTDPDDNATLWGVQVREFQVE